MSNLKSKIETLLFLSAKPLSYRKIEQLTAKPLTEVKQVVEEIITEYEVRGIRIMQQKESVQMISSPENSKLAKELIKDEQTGELTKPALETLTIIAYRGPIAKVELDQIRGVNCSLILRNLMIKGLVEAIEDKEKMTTVYNVTFDFMRFLGISKLKDLPDYQRLNNDENLKRLLEIRAQEQKSESLKQEESQKQLITDQESNIKQE